MIHVACRYDLTNTTVQIVQDDEQVATTLYLAKDVVNVFTPASAKAASRGEDNLFDLVWRHVMAADVHNVG